jgi:uncharacterized membrane protein YedE/YeeE
MTPLLLKPWPWYVTGPLLGLVAIALLVIGNKSFGMSANLRHICAATFPGRVAFFKYDWRRAGLWNLVLVLGVVAGGFVGGVLLANPDPAAITPQAQASLAALGIRDFTGLVPRQLFNWHALLSVRGLLMMVGGGFLVGFGTAYAGGCTSGHGISGLADRQPASLIAVISFFAAGAAASFLLVPLLVPR